MPQDRSSFDVVEDAFAALVRARPAMVLDVPNARAGWRPTPVPVAQLRAVLLDRSVPFATRDAILEVLLCRARAGDPDWSLVLVAVLLPGLRRAAGRLARRRVGLGDEIDAEMLAGLLEAMATSPPAGERLAARLIWAATRRGLRLVRAEAATTTCPLPDEVWESPAQSTTHPDLVLAGGVAAGVITAAEAELIAVTRLEHRTLHDLADSLGIPYETVKKARRRAEHRLAHFLRTGERLVSRRRPPSAFGGVRSDLGRDGPDRQPPSAPLSLDRQGGEGLVPVADLPGFPCPPVRPV
jgi:DNA-directed RNA polymerase specialized sigma24 family protein